MFSVRLVKADHYMNIPIPGLDVRYSDFRGFEVKQVPVIRIFGSTASGQKACLHIHGVFPYFYIPYDGCNEKEKFVYQIASGIDKALNVSLGNSNSHTQHVYKVTVVSAIPLYGFHSKAHQFLKIYFYNPLMIKRASDLLQNGVILDQVFQPHEAHIPFILQFFMDYNLHGMSFVNLASVRYRQSVIEGSDFKAPPLDGVPQELLLPDNILRVSTCKLEVDAVASDILNQQEISAQLTSNPGLRAIWDEEKERRRNEKRNLQFTPQNSQDREASPTASEKFHLERLKKRLHEVSLLNENVNPVIEKSLSGEKRKPYPAPTPEGVNYLEASFLVSHIDSLCCDNVLNKSGGEKIYQNVHNEQGNMEENETLSSPVDPEPNSSQFSTLNSQCLSLVHLLQDLIEDDSVLGSQHQGNDEDNERTSDNEDEVLSQTLDCKELERITSPSSPFRSSNEEKDADTDRREENFVLPQLDGANDQFGEDEEDEDLLKNYQIMFQKKAQQEQLLRIVPDCVSGTSDLPEVVTDYSRDNISLHSDLPTICEPVGLTESKPNIGSYSDLDVVSEAEIGTSLPIELSDNSDSFINETSDSYLLSLDQNDGQKSLFFCESIDSDGLDDSEKGIHPKGLLLGDPWLPAQPIISEKDEYSDEHLSYPKDVWPIDTEGNLWIPASEKYFSETPLMNLPERDEISPHYETADMTELSVEKNCRENRVPSSETKRRLCSLIKSRSKAKEVQSVNKVNSELIYFDDIVNCETTTANENENSTPFGAIFQGSDYEQFLDVSFRDSEQSILSNVGECNLLNDIDLKTSSSCAIEECNKNTFIDEMCFKLQEGLGEEVFEINSFNKLKPKKKLIFSQSNRIDNKISSKQKHMNTRNHKGIRDNLARNTSDCCLSKPKRVGRKSKSIKKLESGTSDKSIMLEEDKMENNYCLRNRVKNINRKRRKRPKQLDVQLKSSESVRSVNDLALDVLQDSMNIDKRIVKERLGILVRNSIGKKCPVKESLSEEKNDPVSRITNSPKTRQSFNSSRSVRSLSNCEKSILVDGNFTLTSTKGEQLMTKPSVVNKAYKSRNPEKIIKNIDVKLSCDTKSSLQTNKLKSSCISMDNNTFSLNSNEIKEDELAKKRIGQYVRQRLGKLVESRAKLSPKSADSASVLNSNVPSLSGKTENDCNKVLTRYRKKKIEVLNPEESFASSFGMNSVGSVDIIVQNFCDNPCTSEVILEKENSGIDTVKGIVTSENCEVSGFPTDNNSIIDTTFVINAVPIQMNCEESGIQTNNLPSVKDEVPMEESDVCRYNTTSIEGPIVNKMVSPEKNSEVNELQIDSNSAVVVTSVKDAIAHENYSEVNLLRTNNNRSSSFSSVKDALTLDQNSEENKLLLNCKSIINKEENEFIIKKSDKICSVNADDILNNYSIRPCYVRVPKWNINKHKSFQIVKSCDKPSKRKLKKKSVNHDKFKLENTKERPEFTCEHNLETIKSGNYYTKPEKMEEETVSQNFHDILSIPGFSNSMDEQSNRLECVKLNMKCVVPNSEKSLGKAEKKTDVGSLKAVVQAESPRVADTLDSLPENPSQTVCHYAPGGIFLHSADRQPLHLDLRENNVVEVAKIPRLGCSQFSKSECASPSEENYQHMPSQTNELIKTKENLRVAEDGSTDFLSFTRGSLKRRSLRSDECFGRKRKRNSENNVEKATCNIPSNANVSLLKNLYKNAVNEGMLQKHNNERKIIAETTENDEQCTNYQITVLKNDYLDEINKKVILGSSPENNSFADVKVEDSFVETNRNVSIRANHERNISNSQLETTHLEICTENKHISHQIVVSEQATELLHLSGNSMNEKTYVKEKMMNIAPCRNTRLNSKNNKEKLNPVKRSKRIFVGNSSTGKIGGGIACKMQLRSVSSLNDNVDIGIKDPNNLRKAGGETVLHEGKHNLKGVEDINCESVTTSHLQISGENYSEIQNKRKMPLSNGNILKETVGQESNLPCVDGANDSCDSDASNGFVLLTSRGRKLKKQINKKMVKTQGRPVLEGRFSVTCDVGAVHGKKLENESNILKNSPGLSPKKQVYKPLNVLIKKDPLKNKSNVEFQLVDPTLNVKIAIQNSHENSDDLRKYLPLVLKRFVTEHDIKKFQPQVIVKNIKSCISKQPRVNTRALRSRRKKVRDEKSICTNHGLGELFTSGEKCEKLKGVSLELQNSELLEKMAFLCKHRGEELAKVTYL